MDTNNLRHFIETKLEDTDFIQGIKGTLQYNVINPTGSWSSFTSPGNDQKYAFDTDECMTLSACNIIETQLNFLKTQGLIPQTHLDFFTSNGYLDSNGLFQLSERFSAIMNGTSINGNGFQNVWQGFRKYGVLPRSMLNYTMAQSQKFLSQETMCEDYYNPTVITDAMKALALKSLNYLIIQWEFVVNDQLNRPTMTDWNNLKTGLKQSPLHIAIPACPDWNTGSVHACGINTPAHGVGLMGINGDGTYAIFDQYNPFFKSLSADYPVPYAVKGTVTINNISAPIPQTLTLFQKILAYFQTIYSSISNTGA